MKNILFFFCVLFLTFFAELNTKSWASSDALIDSYTITLSGAPINTTSALNITLGISSGSASLSSGLTFKAAGASLLLSDVDIAKNVVSVVWSGTASSGVTISGKFKDGSVVGNPTVSVIKIQAAGGKDITTEVIATVQTSGPQATPTPTPTPSPSPTPTPTPTEEEENAPSITLSGPDTIFVRKLRSRTFRILAAGANFDDTSICVSKSSDNLVARFIPRKFFLSSRRSKIFLLGRVSPSVAREIINNEQEEEITLSVSCSNGVEDELDIVLSP